MAPHFQLGKALMGHHACAQKSLNDLTPRIQTPSLCWRNQRFPLKSTNSIIRRLEACANSGLSALST